MPRRSGNFVGVAKPFVDVEPLLLPASGQVDYRVVLLTLAGPYDIRGKWLLLRSALEADPTTDIIVNLDEFGFIDQESASAELSNWGLDSSLHKEWLLDTGKFKEFDGRLARWDVSIGDKVVAGLADLGQPATVDEILDHIQSDGTRGSAVNAISWDSRIVRVNLTQFGLTSWGVTEYVSICSTIRDLIVSSGGSIRLNGLVSTISKEFGAAESSVKAYCGVPMFVLENGWVSLRQDLSISGMKPTPLGTPEGFSGLSVEGFASFWKSMKNCCAEVAGLSACSWRFVGPSDQRGLSLLAYRRSICYLGLFGSLYLSKHWVSPPFGRDRGGKAWRILDLNSR